MTSFRDVDIIITSEAPLPFILCCGKGLYSISATRTFYNEMFSFFVAGKEVCCKQSQFSNMQSYNNRIVNVYNNKNIMYTINSRLYNRNQYNHYQRVNKNSDVGFLPGSLEEKMGPLVAPFIDSLRVIVKQGEKEEHKAVSTQIDDLFTTGTIEITSIAYMRGRSLANSFIIISEAQNLTVSQAKTLTTRVGLSSTIIFEGDVSQIDKPTLSKRSNGLVYLSEKFKGNPLCAQIAMKDSECVRSELAAEASRIL